MELFFNIFLFNILSIIYTCWRAANRWHWTYVSFIMDICIHFKKNLFVMIMSINSLKSIWVKLLGALLV